MSRFNQPIPDSAVQSLLDIQGITSVGMGLDEGERVVLVGAEDQEAASDSRIPGQIAGYRVVVEIEGPVGQAKAEPPIAEDALPTPMDAELANRHRPVPAGVSISHKDLTAGTSAFLATDGDTVYQLSNNHVLTGPTGQDSEGDEIVQPGSIDGGDVDEDTVGTLTDTVTLEDSENLVDAGWYEPASEIQLTTEINKAGSEPINEVYDPELGDEVMFIGRTSGVVTATVDKVNTAVGVAGASQTRGFKDQYRIDTALIPGDSGCPVFWKDDSGDLLPAGIGFAGTQEHGYINYISNVEAETGLTVLPTSADDDSGNGGSDDGGSDPETAGLERKAAILGSLGIAGAYLYAQTADE